MQGIQNFLNQATSAAFNFPRYLERSRKEMISRTPPRIPAYVIETTKKTYRIAKEIIINLFSVLFFPLGIYRALRIAAGFFVVPSQKNRLHHRLRIKFFDALLGQNTQLDTKNRGSFEIFGEIAKQQSGGVITKISDEKVQMYLPSEEQKNENYLIAKRQSVCVDGKFYDAWLLGRKKYLNNKRWMLYSNGNSNTVEGKLAYDGKEIIDRIDALKTNLLLYNYPGVGASECVSKPQTLIKAHRAMLKFLEDDKKGVGAKEIIQWGLSLGGGVQGEVMRSQRLKEGIRYVFVKERTFSKITNVVFNVFLKGLLNFFRWDMGSLYSSFRLERMKQPEIIIQCTEKQETPSAASIKGDGVIPRRGTLAFSLLKKPRYWQYKKFIGTWGIHNQKIEGDVKKRVYDAIKQALSPRFTTFS